MSKKKYQDFKSIFCSGLLKHVKEIRLKPIDGPYGFLSDLEMKECASKYSDILHNIYLFSWHFVSSIKKSLDKNKIIY